uniref:Nephrin n=1 Tax=Globodera rostochiensis TaxID=31243 RepID=A0A914IG31_GLORO
MIVPFFPYVDQRICQSYGVGHMAHPSKPKQMLILHIFCELLKIFGIFYVLLLPLYLPIADAEKFHFKEHPANQSVLIGSDLSLRCSIVHHHGGSNPFHLQWRTNRGIILNQQQSNEIPGYSGRYSYSKENPEELHLNIRNVSLDDDGQFQCQLLKPGGKFFRANAFVTVLVPPSGVRFQHYQSGSTIVVNEGIPLNITCLTETSKPQVNLNLFVNGKKAAENVFRGRQEWENGTIDTYASLALRPGKIHHNKVISCEAQHPETNTNLRDSITLDVYYSSDRPKIDVIGTTPAGMAALKSGQNITLLCTAEGGNPPPQLIWSNQNGRVNEEYSYDMGSQITRNAYAFVVQGPDNGAIYECASQTNQNMSPLISRVTLRVDYPPASVFIFGNTVMRKGESLTMSCVSGVSSPASVVTWQLNGSPTKIQPQEQKKQLQGFVTESNLTIDSSTLLHGQNQITVECLASNGEGNAVGKSHIVRVLSPPSHPFIFDAEPNTVPLEGTLYNLTCEAKDGHPFATLSWFRGVEKLKETQNSLNGDSSRSTVTLLLDRSMNHQQIRCEAENGATDVPLVAKKNLVVLFPPSEVKIQPSRAVHMVASSPAELTCSVPSSNPVAELSWEFPNTVNRQLTISRTGEQIRRSNKPISEYHGFESTNIIQFTPSEAMDKTEVRCTASHHLWEGVKYGSYVLDVKYPPRIAVDGPVSIVIGEGQSFEENVTIYSNPRVNAYAWRKNGITIDRTVGSIFVRQSLIGGNGVTKEASGIYTLFVSNGVGTANATIKIVVEYAARITYITTPVIASVGEDVVLECEADGMPMKSGMIKWFRGNNEVRSLVQDQRRSVIRMNASHDNSGAYTCTVDNGIGQPNYTTAYLLVRRAPVIVMNAAFGRAAGPIGGKAILRCRATAVPNAEFTWGIEGEGNMIVHYNTTKYRFFDTQLDHTTFQSTLTILNLEELDYARRYRCRVSNRLGLVQTFIAVGPPTPPEMPTELEIVNVTNSTASISWTAGFDGGSEQMFELLYQDMDNNEIRSLNTSETQVFLKELKIEHGYRLQIRSINARGEISDLTQPLLFRTMDENLQSGGGFNIISKDGPFSHSAIVALCVALFGLLVLNCLLICYLNRRNKRRKMREKSALNQNGQCGSGRGIQIYGALTALNQQGSTPTTNRSELGAPVASGTMVNNGGCGRNSGGSRGEVLSVVDDNQSTRTIIEVSPYGQFNAPLYNDNDYFYNSTCVAEFDGTESTTDFYAKIQKSCGNGGNFSGQQTPFDANLSYQAIPNPQPPHNMSSTASIQHFGMMTNQICMDMNHYPSPASPYETRSACFVQSTPSHGSTAREWRDQHSRHL